MHGGETGQGFKGSLIADPPGDCCEVEFKNKDFLFQFVGFPDFGMNFPHPPERFPSRLDSAAGPRVQKRLLILQEKLELSRVTVPDEEGVGIFARRQEDTASDDALRPEAMS